MDKNLPNDPLEEFFKKSLEDANELPSDDGWDVPSGNVWDRVEERIQPERKIRAINYWKWTAAAAAVIVLFFGYQWMEQRQEIQDLNAALELKKQKEATQKEVLKNSEAEQIATSENKNNHQEINHQSTATFESVTENQEVVSTDEIENSNEATSFSGENTNGIGGKNNQGSPEIPNSKIENIATGNLNNAPNISPNKTGVENKNEFVQNTIEPDFPKTNSDNSANNVFEKETTASIDKNIQTVEALPSRIFPIKEFELKETERNFTLPTKSIVFNSDNFKPKFYVGAFGSKNLGTRNIVGRKDIDVVNDRKRVLRDSRKKEFWTTGGGVKVGYQFHRNWSIESGIQYTKMEAGTNHKINRNYNSAGETMVNGAFENDYALLIVTSFGDVESDVTLSRNTPIVDQMLFQVRVESRQNVTFLELPIVAKYRMGKGKFKLGLKAGGLTRVVLDSDIEIEAITALSPLLSHRRHQVGDKREIKNLKPVTFDFTAGIEAEFQLSNDFSLSLEPSFSRSLTPIFEKENVKTYPMFSNVKVGVNYFF